MKLSSTKSGDFNSLAEHLLSTYKKFCLNEFLHEKVDTKLYNNFISTWNTILRSLEADYMMGLAKFFERPKDLEKTISIYLFLDYQFKKHDKVITKIRNWRNKFFAHLDAKVSRNSGTFLKEISWIGLRSEDFLIQPSKSLTNLVAISSLLI